MEPIPHVKHQHQILSRTLTLLQSPILPILASLPQQTWPRLHHWRTRKPLLKVLVNQSKRPPFRIAGFLCEITGTMPLEGLPLQRTHCCFHAFLASWSAPSLSLTRRNGQRTAFPIFILSLHPKRYYVPSVTILTKNSMTVTQLGMLECITLPRIIEQDMPCCRVARTLICSDICGKETLLAMLTTESLKATITCKGSQRLMWSLPIKKNGMNVEPHAYVPRQLFETFIQPWTFSSVFLSPPLSFAC